MPAPPSDASPTRSGEGRQDAGDPVGGDIEAYLRQVLDEIDADVEARRASGDLPAGLEQQLDELFLEFAPVGVQGSNRLRESLALVDGAAYVDIAVPTASNRSGGEFIKRLIRKTVRWYFHFVIHQVTRFAWAVSRSLHAIVDRLESLESRVEVLEPVAMDSFTAAQAAPGATWWATQVVDAMVAVRGRTLHAECADGSLVALLAAAGVDAYGVEPHATLLEEAIDRGDDVRAESLLAHLPAVGSGALGGAVLSGSIQWSSHLDRQRVVEHLARTVAPGGLVAIASAEPDAWDRVASPLIADLAPGRPYRAETWEHLFGEVRFERASLTGESGAYLLVLRRT